MKNIEPYKISTALSSLLVNIEAALKETPEISLQEFCKKQINNPIHLLYSVGFNALITIAALVPLKEALNNKKNLGGEWQKLRNARNALCHGTYKFLEDGIEFTDEDPKTHETKIVYLTATEVVELSNKAYDSLVLD